MCEECNGWSNRETWAMALHLDNEEGLSSEMVDLTRLEIEGHDEGEVINPYHLGERMREWIEDEVLDFDNVSLNRHAFIMLTDVGSLYRVNWKEIADNYINTFRENTALADLMGGEVI